MTDGYLSSKFENPRKASRNDIPACSYGVFVAAGALIGVNVAVGMSVPGPGVTGVLVGGSVAVGVTRLTGMMRI